MKSKAQQLREIVYGDELEIAVGCHDGFTAELIQEAGFKVALMSGAGLAGALMGTPDYGLLTLSEMADAARRICGCVDIPIIGDGDNGYGNPLNVRRAIMEFEAAGCAAIQLEDQVTPKKCGHMEGKEVIPTSEHCRKIEMARDTRKEMLILARSDARATHGIEEAIRRVNEYAKAGADFVIIDAPGTVEELKMIADQVTVPTMLNQVEGGKTPVLPKEELKAMGFRGIICYPAVAPLTIIRSMREVLSLLYREGTTLGFSKEKMAVAKDHFELCGLPFYRELEKKYVLAPLDS